MLPSMGICTPTAGLGQTLLTNVNLGLGQDGEPLPPPNKDIARHWPPEIKQLVDDMLELFSRQERESLSAEQIEQKLKIKLERTPLKTDQGGVTANYNITQSIWLTLRADPPDTRSLGVYWFIEHKKTGKTHHHLELALDRDRYCLNPYELAIYTGAKYQPEPPFFTGSKILGATTASEQPYAGYPCLERVCWCTHRF